MHWKTLIILVCAVVVYILMGAAVFLALEAEGDTHRRRIAHSTFADFLGNNTCVSPHELERFAKSVISAYDTGIIMTWKRSEDNMWSYGSSIFFAITVITTIGYGHLAPSTSDGQAFLIIYAIVGIPLCAIMLVGLGERLAIPYMKFDLIRPLSKFPRAEKMLRMVLFTSVCFTIFSLIPAAIIMQFEGWTYLEAWYYTIVTLTTVGFGDYVPDHPPEGSSIYKIVAGIWIFCGLAWLAMVFHMVIFFVRSLTNKISTDDFEIKVVEGHEEVTSVHDKEPLQKNNCCTDTTSDSL